MPIRKAIQRVRERVARKRQERRADMNSENRAATLYRNRSEERLQRAIEKGGVPSGVAKEYAKVGKRATDIVFAAAPVGKKGRYERKTWAELMKTARSRTKGRRPQSGK